MVIVALGLLAVKFIQQLITAIQQILTTSSTDTILEVLSLVDLTLVANLVVIVLLAGWENFVGRLLAAQSAERQVTRNSFPSGYRRWRGQATPSC